ncbi:MAG: hypothetical protein HY816_16135 [Candidatus Wallbacteria bacterium]|nr:hypothetical protein [Candidatus Wallbacteria bacterium]
MKSLRRVVTWVVVVAALAGTVCSPASGADRVAVMRGTVAKTGTSAFDWVGNEKALTKATLAGVNGQETFEANAQNIRQLLTCYETAQRARRRPTDPLVPLHVLLDPNETWAYARWGSPFRLRYPDGRITAPDTGFIHLGEQFDYSSRPTELTSDDLAANRELLGELDGWYEAKVKSWNNRAFALHVLAKMPGCLSEVSVSSEPFNAYVASIKAEVTRRKEELDKVGCSADSFDSWVEEFKAKTPPTATKFSTLMSQRFRFTLEGKTGGLEVYVAGFAHPRFRDELARLVEADLKDRGLGPDVTWARFYQASRAAGALQRLRKLNTVAGLNETFAHELGHIIHFEATAGQTGNTGDSGNPKDRGSHSIRTLSNPGFALSEGWAEALALSYGRQSPDAAFSVATKIDYADSLKPLREYVNGFYAGAVVQKLRAQGRLKTGETLALDAQDPMGLDLPTFRQKVAAAAAAKGLTAADQRQIDSTWDRDPQMLKHRKRLAYLEDLQAHKGDKKLRHDFLSSEASVSVALFRLARDLGPEVYPELAAVMATSKPPSLAKLLEAYVAAKPMRKVAVYRSLAASTEGILVTSEQAELVAQDPTLHIDLDRDGKVPGRNAAHVRPALFPPEPISYSPIPLLAVGEDPLAPSSPSGGSPAIGMSADVISTRAGDGIVAIEPEGSVSFEGLERD